jgi:hypothetical protein
VSETPALWLLLDTETSGFLDSNPVLVEIAWTLVRSDTLVQESPLRQRLCAIQDYPTPVTQWPAWKMGEDAWEMHDRSGLRADWNRASTRVGNVAELDDLVHADINAALARMPALGETPVHVAGAGVARFEMRLLPQLGSRLLHRYHYGPIDTTVAARTLGVPKVVEPDPDDGLTLNVQDGCDPVKAATDPHRAATDVRAAYRQIRDLRARMKPETADSSLVDLHIGGTGLGGS